MVEFLEVTQDKFTFKVATDRVYSADGVWVKIDGEHVKLGVSDFFQQHNGDVAFVEIVAVETAVIPNETIATIETIKVDIELPSPISGTVIAVNDALEMEAELINADPYGDGWLLVIAVVDWEAEQADLMSPEAYLAHMQYQIQEEGII